MERGKQGKRCGVVWLWVVVVGIAIGLPAATLALVTVHQRRGPRLNRVDRWLYDRYRLEWVDRSRVKEAVLQGRPLSEPALREAAHGLAGAMLAGQVGGLGVKTIRMVIGAETSLVVAILVFVLATGNYSEVGSVIAGFLGMALAISSHARTRRRITHAFQVNG
jgi:hypothetical protein